MILNESQQVPKNPTYKKIYELALELFQYDRDKTNAWWLGKSEQLDGKAPYEWVKEGKGRKLIKLIERCRG